MWILRDAFLVNAIPKGMYLKKKWIVVKCLGGSRWEDTSICENNLHAEKLAASSADKTVSTIARKLYFSLIISIICLQL